MRLDAAVARQRQRAASARVRRSLRASFVEGMLAEVVGGFAGGTILTAWALHLQAGAFELALLAALPNLSQLVRLPGAWLVEKLTARRLAIPAIVASRVVLFALIGLPWLPLSPARARTLLVVIAASSSLLSIIGNCGWTVWIAELVPSRLRGRYFGRRTAAATIAAMSSALVASLAVDLARRSGHEGAMLSALAAVASVAGLVTWPLLVRQHDPPQPPRSDGARERHHAALAPLVDMAMRPLLAFQLAWNAALGLAAAFFTLYLVGPLGLGWSWVALHALALSTMRVLTAPAWGRLVDRIGARNVVVVCSLALAPAPLLWLCLTRANVWLVALDPVWVGVFTAGHSLAMFDLPLRKAPRRGRAYYLATFSMTGGAGFALAAAVGGALASSTSASSMHALFAASAGARLVAAAVARRIR